VLNGARTTAARQFHTFDGGDDPQVVLRLDASLPHEKGRALDTFSVLYDPLDEKVKMWYMVGSDCGTTCNRTSDEEDGTFSYAESVDGVAFTKPAVGRNGWQGTNVLGANVAGPSVFLNGRPGAPPAERFVSVGECHGRAPICKGNFAWMTSADGLRWNDQQPSTCAIVGAADTVYTSFWDAGLAQYVSYTRDRYGTGNAIRRVRRVSTDNGSLAAFPGPRGAFYSGKTCPWRHSEVVMDIDAKDNATHPWNQSCVQKWPPWGSYTTDPPIDLYGAVVWRLDMMASGAASTEGGGQGPGGGAGAAEGAAGRRDAGGFSSVLYWAFPWRFWHFTGQGYPGTYDVALMVSRDGSNFTHLNQRRAFVRTGRDGTAGARRVRLAPSPVLLGDTILFYLYLTNEIERYSPHTATDGRPVESCIGVLRMRLDGWASLGTSRADFATPVRVTTKPLVMHHGSKLVVNLDAINGAMRTAILQPGTDEPFVGFGFADCVTLSANSVNATVGWRSGGGVERSDVSELRGKEIVLQFELVEGEVYSFQFV
jgi:hypothetical protein